MCEMAGRALPSPYLADDSGAVRLINGDPLTWDRLVSGAFDQVRQSADFHAPVYVHMLESLRRIAGCVRDPDRLEPLLRQAGLVVGASKRHVAAAVDQEVIDRRYDDVVAAVASAREP